MDLKTIIYQDWLKDNKNLNFEDYYNYVTRQDIL